MSIEFSIIQTDKLAEQANQGAVFPVEKKSGIATIILSCLIIFLCGLIWGYGCSTSRYHREIESALASLKQNTGSSHRHYQGTKNSG